MKLCLIISTLEGAGGAERVLVTLANAWAERPDHDVTLVTFDNEPSFYPIAAEVTQKPLNLAIRSGPTVQRVLTFGRRFTSLRRLFKQERFDAIIVFATRANVIALISAIGVKTPLFVSERINPEFVPVIAGATWAKLARRVYPLATAVVMQTSGSQQHYERMWPENRVTYTVIANPIEPRRPKSTRIVDYPLIVSVGRLVHQKGQDTLIKAFAQIAPDFPEWQLELWGKGELQTDLEQLASQLDMAGRIHFCGVTHDVGGVLASAELFAFPSRYEGFPNALGEALAAGLPTVSADCPYGPADMITDGDNGLLTPIDDVEALANALRNLMANRDRRQKFAARAADSAARFSLSNIMIQWDALIQSSSACGTAAQS